jgi:1,2-phenylacetyl-CoA epoxidase catalytic subunit
VRTLSAQDLTAALPIIEGTAMRNVCLEYTPAWTGVSVPAWTDMAVDSHGLNDSQRQDLADVLPYLACGEASAVHAFSGRLSQQLPLAARATLSAIVQDEMGHALWIEALQKTLPPPQRPPQAARLLMFFRRLESAQPAEHLAHVAALDRAVCQLLHPMLRRGGVISQAPDLHRALCALRQDEARHVRMSRAMAQQLGMSAGRQALLNQSIGARLLSLLQPVRPALARLSLGHRAASWREAA